MPRKKNRRSVDSHRPLSSSPRKSASNSVWDFSGRKKLLIVGLDPGTKDGGYAVYSPLQRSFLDAGVLPSQVDWIPSRAQRKGESLDLTWLDSFFRGLTLRYHDVLFFPEELSRPEQKAQVSLRERILVCYELPPLIPKGAFGTAYLYRAIGHIEALAMRISLLDVMPVNPRSWKVSLFGSEQAKRLGKSVSVDYVLANYPEVDLTPGRLRNPHHGIADACCIAVYAASQLGYSIQLPPGSPLVR